MDFYRRLTIDALKNRLRCNCERIRVMLGRNRPEIAANPQAFLGELLDTCNYCQLLRLGCFHLIIMFHPTCISATAVNIE